MDTPSRWKPVHLPWKTGSDGPQIGIPHKRHSFAVRRLLEWHRSGEDPQARMPVLSAYLGHVSPAGTYWYLTAVPELMELAAARLARGPAR